MMELIPRVTRPRIEFGADWDAERFVLARKDGKELQWRKATRSWVCRGAFESSPGWLVLMDYSKSREHHDTLHDSGGRLSRALLAGHAKEIDAFFGERVTAFINPKMTLEIQ